MNLCNGFTQPGHSSLIRELYEVSAIIRRSHDAIGRKSKCKPVPNSRAPQGGTTDESLWGRIIHEVKMERCEIQGDRVRAPHGLM